MSVGHKGDGAGAAPTYITPDGFQRLRDELQELQLRERPKVVQEVTDAAAQGDRSENAEYIYGKRRLREIDRRVRFLSKRLANSQVVDPRLDRGARVFFGATVQLLDADSGEVVVYQIVGPDDVLDARRISYRSPVGAALLGRALDDEVVVRTPAGARHFSVMEILYI